MKEQREYKKNGLKKERKIRDAQMKLAAGKEKNA